jgi:hypothetical protein
MAKKKETTPQPAKVSQLPLPISDSPLVIDLPDGQKLVIGKMAEGSVIEVATWRGTGRPDSRTSRLMLGMSPGNIASDGPDATGYSSGSKPDKQLTGIAKYLAPVMSILKKVFNLLKKLPLGKLKKIKLPSFKRPIRKKRDAISAIASLSSSNSENSQSSQSSESKELKEPTDSIKSIPTSASSFRSSKSESKDEVDDWLAQIMQKAESKSKIEPKAKASTQTSVKAQQTKKKAVTTAKKTTKGQR